MWTVRRAERIDRARTALVESGADVPPRKAGPGVLPWMAGQAPDRRDGRFASSAEASPASSVGGYVAVGGP